MLTRWVAMAVLFVIGGLAACGGPTSPGDADGPPPLLTALPRSLTPAEREAASSSMPFALELLRTLAMYPSGKANVVISPFSANVALGMAWAGASGETETEMQRVLGWQSSARAAVLDAYRTLPALLRELDPAVELSSANALWAREGTAFSVAWRDELTTHFAATLRTGGFGRPTVDSINDWASQQTNGRITRVLERLDPLTVGVLLNALWFRADWRARFDPARTRNEPFLIFGSPVAVPMMHRTDTMRYGETRGAQLVELPYGNGAFVLDVILPNGDASPRAFLQSLDSATFGAMLAATAMREVELSMPRFTVEAHADLVPPLTSMGMTRAFDPFRAEFARMGDEDFHLSAVRQDVWMRVDESGTEAAAVTTVEVGVTSVPIRPVMTVDRPFLFLLRERLSGTVLFAGIIADPRG